MCNDNLIEQLKEYMSKTTKEQRDADWKKICDEIPDDCGPSVAEYLGYGCELKQGTSQHKFETGQRIREKSGMFRIFEIRDYRYNNYIDDVMYRLTDEYNKSEYYLTEEKIESCYDLLSTNAINRQKTGDVPYTGECETCVRSCKHKNDCPRDGIYGFYICPNYSRFVAEDFFSSDTEETEKQNIENVVRVVRQLANYRNIDINWWKNPEKTAERLMSGDFDKPMEVTVSEN